MKNTKLVIALACALTMLGTASVFSADAEKPCCKATVAAGKKCKHECCVKAAEDGKVCEKCHPKKEDKK